jgi:hypothetical protein
MLEIQPPGRESVYFVYKNRRASAQGAIHFAPGSIGANPAGSGTTRETTVFPGQGRNPRNLRNLWMHLLFLQLLFERKECGFTRRAGMNQGS